MVPNTEAIGQLSLWEKLIRALYFLRELHAKLIRGHVKKTIKYAV